MGAPVKRDLNEARDRVTIQKPSICRAVIYTDNAMNIHPAVVTSVESLDLDTVNLFVMIDGGGSRWVKSVPHHQDTLVGNSWRWPDRS